MSVETENRAIVSELHLLASQRVLTVEEMRAISERYPTGDWDLTVLARWFTIIGAVTAAGGMLVLAQFLIDWKNLLDGGLLFGAFGLIYLAHYLRGRAEPLPRTAAALELCAGFALQGLSAALAIRFSTGSDNWPALIGGDTALLIFLAYLLKNRLVLIHALCMFFLWFGGSTGYDSHWGAYWLGMDYPLRFVFIGVVTLGFAFAHFRLLRGVYQSFSRVYAHFGLLVLNLALWFFSLFGYFELEVRWEGTLGQRLAFSGLWAAASVASVIAGSALGIGVLRAYGMVFLIIDLYTAYFQFVVYHSTELAFIHLLFSGGTMVALGFFIEGRRKQSKASTPDSASPPDSPAQAEQARQ